MWGIQRTHPISISSSSLSILGGTSYSPPKYEVSSLYKSLSVESWGIKWALCSFRFLCSSKTWAMLLAGWLEKDPTRSDLYLKIQVQTNVYCWRPLWNVNKMQRLSLCSSCAKFVALQTIYLFLKHLSYQVLYDWEHSQNCAIVCCRFRTFIVKIFVHENILIKIWL